MGASRTGSKGTVSTLIDDELDLIVSMVCISFVPHCLVSRSFKSIDIPNVAKCFE